MFTIDDNQIRLGSCTVPTRGDDFLSRVKDWCCAGHSRPDSNPAASLFDRQLQRLYESHFETRRCQLKGGFVSDILAGHK